MTLNQLEYFLTAAQYSSLTKASKKLYVTHSTISRGISDLESEFGVPLFIRENHNLTLTNAGNLLVEHCKKVMADIQDLKADMTKMASDGKKILRICMPPMDIKSGIYSAISKFQEQYPDISLSIKSLDLNHIEDAMINHELDLAITYSFIIEQMNLSFYNYASHNLFQENICAVINKDWPEAKLDAIDVHSTNLKHPLVLENADTPFLERVMPSSLFQDHRNPDHHQPLSLNSVILSVVNGVGWTCLAECEANRLSSECKVLPLKGVDTSHYVAICWRREPKNPSLDKLAQIIINEFSN